MIISQSSRLKMQKPTNRGTEKYCTDFTAMEILSTYAKHASQNMSKEVPSAWIEADRAKAFRQELDGILVYDSHARINDEEIQEAKEQLEKPAVDLDTISDFDKYQFQNLPPLHPQRHYPQTYHLQTPRLKTLFFDSRFESGNLRKAARVSEDDYNMWLETDYGTLGHTQWYYFTVKPFKASHTVTFTILNLMKPFSLYSEGLRPVIFSRAASELHGEGWTRGGTNIQYFENSMPKPGGGYYYSLRFKYTFEYAEDEVSFAHCYPYTMQDLQQLLAKHIESDSLRVDSLCETLGGNTMPVLTVTKDISTYCSWEEETSKLYRSAAGRRLIRLKAQKREIIQIKANQLKGKKTRTHTDKQGIIITARVHPGESNSSYVMEGFLEFLLGNSKTARFLRSRFVFKIIPMLNPDGVIYGNYRTSLLGIDLNRRWRHPSKEVHPEIFYTKRLFQVFNEDHKVLLYCDLHGHSAKKNAFMYGCRHRGVNWSVGRSNALIKVFPALMAQHNAAFSLQECKYRMERSKQSTGRIVVFKELGINNSYTLECSFQGTENAHFTQDDLKHLGASLCRQILALSCPRFFKKKLERVTHWVSQQSPQQPLGTVREEVDEESDSELEDPTLDEDDDWSADLLQLIGDDVIALFNISDDEGAAAEDSEDSNSCSSDGEEPRGLSPEQSYSSEDLGLRGPSAFQKARQKSSKHKIKLINKSQSIPEVSIEDAKSKRRPLFSTETAKPESRQAEFRSNESKSVTRKLGTPLTMKKPVTSHGTRALDKIITLRNLTRTFDAKSVSRNVSSSFRSDAVSMSQIKLSSSFIDQQPPEPTVKTAKTAGGFITSTKALKPIASNVKIASIDLPNSYPQKSRIGLSSTFKHKKMSQLPSLQRYSRKDKLTANSFFL
mmetsp:Transcript_25116/g.44018  ORF Transcript_25116/g.44018 Transcript_25116/m.44018 type:complete len:893 (-) Transcript_25116:460-3138(-)